MNHRIIITEVINWILNRENYAIQRAKKEKKRKELVRSSLLWRKKINKSHCLYDHTRESFSDSRYRKLRLSTPPRRHAFVVFFLTWARWNLLTGFGVNHKKRRESIAAVSLFWARVETFALYVTIGEGKVYKYQKYFG